MAELMNCPECGEPLDNEKLTSPVGDIPIKVCHQCKKWWGAIQAESKPQQLKMRLWDLWKKEDTLNQEYSVIDVHIAKRLLMGRVAALIDEVFGLQFSDVAGLPLGGFEELTKHWIVNEKVKVSKDWDNILFTSLQSKQKENLTMYELLEMIKGKGIGGIGIIGYDDTNSFTLTLLDPHNDVERTP